MHRAIFHGAILLSSLALLLGAPFVSRALAQEEEAEASQAESPPDPNEDLDNAARLTFQAGRQAFQAGDYETALERFETAYRLSSRPGLLYNLGATYDRLRRDREALDAFERFLASSPNAPNAAEIRARMEVLRRAVEEEDRRLAQQQQQQQQQQGDGGGGGIPAPILHQAIFWSGLGLTLAAGGVLAWSGVDTLSLNDAYQLTDTEQSAQVAYDAAIAAQERTNILVGVTAGLGLITAVLLFITDFGGGEEEASEGGGEGETAPALGLGPGGFTLGLTHRF